MCSTLLLDSFRIQGFRAFRDLEIERLGRINLITGKNNVGKSCLLEALHIFFNNGSPSTIMELLHARDEAGYTPLSEKVAERSKQELGVRFLFHGRSGDIELAEPIRMGPIRDHHPQLEITTRWATWSTLESGRRELQVLEAGEQYKVASPILTFVLRLGAKTLTLPAVSRYPRSSWPSEMGAETADVFLAASGLDMSNVGSLWDAVALTALEDDVVAALRIIAPSVERVALVGDTRTSRHRISVVRLSDMEDPVPLRTLGGGMNRLFGIALALVNTKGGVLLIDEIDSGLHHSIQYDLWKMIFSVANRLSIQVFATTHSWDCISAFQQAAAQNAESTAVLIRLSQSADDVMATVFDERKLAIATREQIEVR